MSDINLPFQLEGKISYLSTRRPLKVELKEYEGEYMFLTLNTPEWDPHTTMYTDQEHTMVKYKGHIKEKCDTRSKSNQRISAVINRSDLDIASEPTLFESSVSSLALGEMHLLGVKSRNRKVRVNEKELSERIKIPPGMDQKKIQATNQLEVRTVEEPSLTRKFRTNDRMLRNERLAFDTFIDTFFSSNKYVSPERGYTSLQVFDTGFVRLCSTDGRETGIKISQVIKKYFKKIGVPLHLI